MFMCLIDSTTASVVGRLLGYDYFKRLCNELFSYCGEYTLPVNKMSQIKSYYELSI